MSAFVVGKGHIDYLVAAAVRYKVIPTDDKIASELGQSLWNENWRSVVSLYAEKGAYSWGRETYVATYNILLNTKIEPVRVLKAIQCLMYQSCEHKEWEGSDACATLERLRSEALCRLPGYEQAEWAIGTPEQVAGDTKPTLGSSLVVTISVENDAFKPDPTPELAKILMVLAGRFQNDGMLTQATQWLRDGNGNVVGRARFVVEE